MVNLSITLRNMLQGMNYNYAMASKQNGENLQNAAQNKNTSSNAAAQSSVVNTAVTSNNQSSSVNTATAKNSSVKISSLSSSLSNLLKSVVTVSNTAQTTSKLDNTSVITNDMETEFFKSYKNAVTTGIYNKLQTNAAMTSADLANFKAQIEKLSADEQKLWKTEISKIEAKIAANIKETTVNTPSNTQNTNTQQKQTTQTTTPVDTKTEAKQSTASNTQNNKQNQVVKSVNENGMVKGYNAEGTLVYLEKMVNGKKIVYTDELSYLNPKTRSYVASSADAVLNDRILSDIKIVQNAEKAGLKAGAEGSTAYEKAYNASIKSQMIKSASTGEIGEVVEKNGLLYVNDGSGLKKLNMSAETYLELFPPVDRYDVNQSSLSDCFLVSGALIDGLKNPTEYAKLLQMFSEDSNGNITLRFSGSLGAYPVTFTKGELKAADGKVNGVKTSKFNTAAGSLGTKMIEQAYAIAKFAKENNQSVSSIDVDATVSTIKGGWQYNVYDEVFGIDSERKYVPDTSIASYLNLVANDVNNGKMILSFDSYGDISKYNLTSSHAYSIESIDTANQIVYISNPWYGGGSTAVPYSEFAKTSWKNNMVMNVGYVNA